MLKPNSRIISALFLWWALGSSSTLALELPELRYEMSGDALFIGVGSHKTYRRYTHYLSTPEGRQTLFNSFLTGYLTLFVDFHAALWVSQRFSNPQVKSVLFPSVLLLLPLAVRSTASWLKQRLQQEQIRADNKLIDDLFFIEMLYDLAPDQQALEIRPVPESLTHHSLSDSDSARNPSLWLWQELYQSLQYHQVSSFRLSWYEHGESRGILVALQSINNQEPSYRLIEIFGGDSLPVSIEFALHNEWRPDTLLEHSGYSQPVISLLKDEVIALVTAVINDPVSTVPGISLESLVTSLQPDNNALGFTASLCHQDHPACNTSLQLIWQAFPYPHYRPKLFFDNPSQDQPQREIILNTAEQLADTNLAELMMQTFEGFLVMATFASFQYLPELKAQPSGPAGVKVVVGEPQGTLAIAPSTGIRTAISRSSIAQWRATLLNLHQRSTPDIEQTVCQKLTDQQFNWQGFLSENGEASADLPSLSALAEVFQNLSSEKQNAVLNSMLAKSPGDFIDTLQSIPGDTLFSWLDYAASQRNNDSSSISAHLGNLTDHQLETFINTLLDKYTGVHTQEYRSLFRLIEMLSEQGKEILVSRCARESSVELSSLFYRLLLSKPEAMAEILTRVTTNRHKLGKTLSWVLAADYEQSDEESRIRLKALLPLMTLETFKEVYLGRRVIIDGWGKKHRSVRPLIQLIREATHLGDPAAIEFFSRFNSDEDTHLVHVMLKDADENPSRDSGYRDRLFEIAIRPNGARGIKALLADQHIHGYMAFLLRLRHRDQPLATSLIRRIGSGKLAEYLAARLILTPSLGDDEIQIIINNTEFPRAYFDIIARNPVLMTNEHRRHFAKLLPDIFFYIISAQKNDALPPLIDWLASLPDVQLKDIMEKTVKILPLPDLTWLTRALNTLVNDRKVPTSQASLILANALSKHFFYKPENFICEMDQLLGTSFAIKISEMADHNDAFLHDLFLRMNNENLAYYLAELTKNPDLWQSHNQDVIMAAIRLNSRRQLPMVMKFNPDMERYNEMSGRLAESSQPQPQPQPQPASHNIAKYFECLVCQRLCDIPTAMHNFCGQTFCKKCLQTLQQGERVGLKCPACRELIELEKDFTRNLMVESLIENEFGDNRER